jgi:outer membrane protein OmpA-like peptidoglycan-associated protein
LNLRAIIFLVSFCFSLSIFSQEKSKENVDSLVNNNYPEICPAFNLEDHIYSPNYYLTESYYKSRYKEIDLTSKITDNKGNGYDSLYGTRNLRPLLHGVAYRGGANNYFHKTAKRKNSNPLPKDGLNNLCVEGFSSSIYLYQSNWDSSLATTNCNCINNTKNQLDYYQLNYFNSDDIIKMLALVYESALNKDTGPVYFHCWNGWHASGFIAALCLKQFCGFSSLEAVNYWDLCTDGTNISPRYNSIRQKIKDFIPIDSLMLKDSIGNKICPPMPKTIDSTQLHISLEHLKLVPESIPVGTILILENIAFKANRTILLNPKENIDLILLKNILQNNDSFKIEISGHTDNSGNKNTNKQLSVKRAKFIYEFLITENIPKEQLSFKGYGSIMPAYSNRDKTGRAANRRIEIKLLQKTKEDFTVLAEEKQASLRNLLQSITINNNIVLSDIQFQATKSELTQKAKSQLDTVVAFLQKNVTHHFSIIGYTDASGVEAKNITLSKKRAQKVYDYLIKNKVDKETLFYSGCGSENPIATNKYEWGRLKNRRIELQLLKK